MRKLSYLLAAMLFAVPSAFSQNVEMADGMRSEGKIYVVVACLVLIQLGFVAYLFYLDRKLTKRENH
jgi:hypothetical protein